MDIKNLVTYFESGCKNEQFLGLELEHFVVCKDSGASLPYDGGVEELLKKAVPNYGEPILIDGRTIGISRKHMDITLEPAAQLEVSIGPFLRPAEVLNTYNEFLGLISPALDEANAELARFGYHPVSKIDELPLLPKKRYEHMYSYFLAVGTHGMYMMKGTASTQVCIDYRDEGDFKKKFRVANILGPIFSFIYDNTPVFEGKPAPHRMMRTHIWNNVDPCRCMVVPGALDNPDFGFREYAEYLLFVPEIFAADEPSVMHTASMVFPDVRLKTSLELRMADSLPIDVAISYLELVMKIFYDSDRLSWLYKNTTKVKNADVARAKAELIRHGENAVIYGRNVKELVKEWLP